jgi:hypothetical protein
VGRPLRRLLRPAGLHWIKTFIGLDRLVVFQGIYEQQGADVRFTARFVHIVQDKTGQFLFEQTHWWLTQIARLVDWWFAFNFLPKNRSPGHCSLVQLSPSAPFWPQVSKASSRVCCAGPKLTVGNAFLLEHFLQEQLHVSELCQNPICFGRWG